MPLDRPLRKAACAKPTYIYSEDDDDDDNFPEPAVPALSAPRSSHTRKRPSNHIRRPRNAFIIFRSEFCERQKMNETGVESDHRQISRIAAHVWNSLPEEEKARYRVLADQEKEIHKRAYPDYRYAPAGRPRVANKHKEKREDTEDRTRCRKIADLLLCGYQGRAFVEAAKKLAHRDPDRGPPRRTSRPSRSKGKNLPPPPDTLASDPAAIELEPAVVTPSSDAAPFISPSPPPSPGLPTPSPTLRDGTVASLASSMEEKAAQEDVTELSLYDLLYGEEMFASHSASMMLSHLNAAESVDGIPDWGVPSKDRAFESTLEHFSSFIPDDAGDDMASDYSVNFSDYLLDTVVEGLSD